MIFRGVDGNQTLNRAKLCLSKHSTSQPSRAERQLTTFFLITSVILRTVYHLIPCSYVRYVCSASRTSIPVTSAHTAHGSRLGKGLIEFGRYRSRLLLTPQSHPYKLKSLHTDPWALPGLLACTTGAEFPILDTWTPLLLHCCADLTHISH